MATSTTIKGVTVSKRLDDLRNEFIVLREERRDGKPHLIYRERLAYEKWFRESVRAGRSPDALVQETLYGEEHLRSLSVPGADHTYWKGGYGVRLEGGRSRKVEYFVMELVLGRKLDDYNEVVERTCGTPKCIKSSHLMVRPKRRRTMSNEEAIARMRAAAVKLGRTPHQDDSFSGMPNVVTLRKLFGSFSAALEAAGLEFTSTQFQSIPDETIYDALRARAVELGRAPQAGEWEANRWTPSYATISRRHSGQGGFRGALQKAGVA